MIQGMATWVENTSQKTANYLIKEHFVDADGQEECAYGIELLMMMAINIISIALISLAFGMLLEGIVFLVCFKSLRKYVGGYHASAFQYCYMETCATCVVALSIMRWVMLSPLVMLGVLLVCCGVLFKIAPIDSSSKPLDEIEVKVYGRRAKISVAVAGAMVLLLLYLSWQHMAMCLLTSVFAVTVLAILGKNYNK